MTGLSKAAKGSLVLLGFELIAIIVFVFVDWRSPLMLVPVYGIYVPHLFLRVANISDGGLAGPVAGWEVLLGFCIAFWLTVPLLGDLAFWVASVLFAMGQFHGALIVGGIALGLTATLYPLALVRMYASSRIAPGGILAVALRLASMGLLLVVAWRAAG
jgi:hypothetical protein